MAKCNIFDKCGGCKFPHNDYQKTIEFKKKFVLDALKKENHNVTIDQVVTSSNPFAYRNKMQITFSNSNGKVKSGFYEENSHKVVDLDFCPIHTDIQNEIASYIKELVNKLKLRAFDEDRNFGLIRHVLIKEGFVSKQIMVVIVTASEIFPGRNDFVKLLRAKFPNITTIIQNINPRKTSIVLGEKERVLFGKGFIEDYLCGLKFKITSKSFFQINPEVTNKMYYMVSVFADIKDTDIVLDSYSGVGTIGMVLSKNAKKVISVESNKQAVAAAIMNAKDNNIKNVEFICDDATNFIIELSKLKEKIDVLIMDPPRTGSTPEFLNSVNKLLPRKIVYVSCDVTTLARDLNYLKKNYNISKYSIFDMFCWTGHVESCVLLERR